MKDLVSNEKLGAEVRKAAMSALAAHWKSDDDLEWLEDEVGSDPALREHVSWLAARLYEKEGGGK